MPKRYKGNIAFKTDQGRVRINNEDQARAAINSQGDVLLIVCDGMGGQNKGDYASRLAVETIIEAFRNKEMKGPLFFRKLWFERIIKKANSAIFDEAQKSDEYKDMGTTLVACYITGEKIIVFNIGDSRAYWLKNNRLERLSEDQTYVDYLYRTGKITKDETMSHPDRHVLMNALGIYPSCSMDVKTYAYHGERVILCSDGLYNNVSETEISQVVSTDERPDLFLGRRNSGIP